MHARLLLASAALIGLTAFAPVPFPRPKKPAASLDGEWRQVSRRGKPIVGGPGSELTIVIGEGRWTFVREFGPGSPAKRTAYFIVSAPSAKPATFDLRKSPTDPMPYGVGIWRIDGDELRIAYSWGRARPADFTPNKDRGVFWMTLRRVKK